MQFEHIKKLTHMMIFIYNIMTLIHHIKTKSHIIWFTYNIMKLVHHIIRNTSSYKEYDALYKDKRSYYNKVDALHDVISA